MSMTMIPSDKPSVPATAPAVPAPCAAPLADVVIADKNPLIQRGLKQLFEEDGRFRVIATAADGERFLEAVERLHFDIGVIGWVMPFADGRTVLERLRDRVGAPRIVVYTGAEDPDLPRQVMMLGGAGFCSKGDEPEHLVEVLAGVAAGRMVFPFVDLRRRPDDPLDALTPRERDLLGLLGTGRSNAQIARHFGISPHTVKFHLKNLYEKLGVRNRAQAVALHLGAR